MRLSSEYRHKGLFPSSHARPLAGRKTLALRGRGIVGPQRQHGSYQANGGDGMNAKRWRLYEKEI